jgi:hypothetical protein
MPGSRAAITSTWPPPKDVPQSASRAPSTPGQILSVLHGRSEISQVPPRINQPARRAFAVPEPSVIKQQNRQACGAQPLGEGRQAKAPLGAEPVSHNHYRWRELAFWPVHIAAQYIAAYAEPYRFDPHGCPNSSTSPLPTNKFV